MGTFYYICLREISMKKNSLKNDDHEEELNGDLFNFI